MLEADARDTERKIVTILRVLSESSEPVGSIHIARELENHGIHLSERAVRYHLKMTDERGFTRPLGRDGRTITPNGLEELRVALASEQVGFVIERIELLAFQTTFSPETPPFRERLYLPTRMGPLTHWGSRGSSPAMTSRARATSATVLAIGQRQSIV